MNPRLRLLLGPALLLPFLVSSPGSSREAAHLSVRDLDAQIASLDLEAQGMKLGIQVVVEGKGTVYNRAAQVPRSTASAIKTAIAVDLLRMRGDKLEEVPVGVESLLRPGVHPAFSGFTPEELEQARYGLTGKTYWELARIMMGRDPAKNEVYNAACNLIMIKLGGPEAIGVRLRKLHPDLDVNRYMQSWNGDGDNSATPQALVSLYRMTSSGQVPGLDENGVRLLRELLLDRGEGGPGSIYEKMGTLFPQPMVRVHAGYQTRESGNLVYAIMGEIPERIQSQDGADVFLRLMTAVDNLTAVCHELETP